MSKPSQNDPQPAPSGRMAFEDPYSMGDKREVIAKRAPRRTLDDMRKLSEEIKRARALKTSP